jgi:hypothetical protein
MAAPHVEFVSGPRCWVVVGIWLANLVAGGSVTAGDLVVSVTPANRVARLGVVRRFDDEGALVRPVDPKAQFDAPYLDFVSESSPARFENLPAGIYDIIMFLDHGTRLEGFHWPMFGEFEDPEEPAFQHPPSDEVGEIIREQIAQNRYYENKVTPLALAGDDEHVRVLMQLLRDEKTSFDAQFGAPVDTLRYEVWQFTNHFGGWTRDKGAKVLHRILDARDRMNTRTWLWDRALGGIRITDDGDPVRLAYELDETTLKGLVGLKGEGDDRTGNPANGS